MTIMLHCTNEGTDKDTGQVMDENIGQGEGMTEGEGYLRGG